MRKVKYYLANSLDNFIARPDGAVDWLFMDGDYGMAEFFRSVDAVLVGRKTYDVAVAHARAASKRTRKKSGKIGFDMKSYVFSRSLAVDPDDGVEVVSDNAAGVVRALKEGEGKDIWLMGGGALARSLFAENVVDEIGLNIHPVLLGSGVPLFGDIGRQLDLELFDHKVHPNGCIQVWYRIKA